MTLFFNNNKTHFHIRFFSNNNTIWKRQVEQAHGAGPGLMQSGRQYASRVVQETKKIREAMRTLQSLQTMKDNGLKVGIIVILNLWFPYMTPLLQPQTDPNEANGPDIDVKIDEVKNQLRRSEVCVRQVM